MRWIVLICIGLYSYGMYAAAISFVIIPTWKYMTVRLYPVKHVEVWKPRASQRSVFELKTDTLSATPESGDTLYLYPSGDSYGSEIEVVIVADSISGSTDATITIEATDYRNKWHKLADMQADGSVSQVAIFSDSAFRSEKLRITAIAPQGSQQTKIMGSWTIKPIR